MSYLVRVRLPDRPGALGHLASALGGVGADILNMAVVDRADGAAVDDLVVELPPGILAEQIYTAVRAGGAAVESIQRWGGRLELADDLDLLDRIAEEPADGLALLVEWAPEVLRANWALLVTPVGVLHRSPGAPPGRPDLGWLPIGSPKEVPAAIWAGHDGLPDLEQVAAPVGTAGAAVLVGRSGGPAFRRSERARLGHLAAIAAALAHEILTP